MELFRANTDTTYSGQSSGASRGSPLPSKSTNIFGFLYFPTLQTAEALANVLSTEIRDRPGTVFPNDLPPLPFQNSNWTRTPQGLRRWLQQEPRPRTTAGPRPGAPRIGLGHMGPHCLLQGLDLPWLRRSEPGRPHSLQTKKSWRNPPTR